MRDPPGQGTELPRPRGRSAHQMLDPEAVAETCWQIRGQHPTAWTHELDLLPAVESF